MMTDTEILEEVKKMQYFYGLKHEIRYGETRIDMGESVAEHIYGMHVLSSYFLPLEDPEGAWNREHIFAMITWHDMDELETGDMIGYKKTQEDRDREVTAMDTVLSKIPEHMRPYINRIVALFQKQESPEARFVKALDKIEPLFHLYNENGKRILKRNGTTQEDSRRIKDAYVADFPHLRAFNDALNNAMEREGYFARATIVA
jgi:5'-deoxynucleotidase YfbR-like HD superfamily hydrolase